MTDTIQERLRRFAEYDSEDNHTDQREHICTEAADEIDRLRAELDEEREAYKTALSNRNYWRRAQRKELLLKEHAERELDEKDKRIEELVSERDSLVRLDAMKETLLRQASARISELETQMEVGLNPDDQGRLIIHPDQINAAWDWANLPEKNIQKLERRWGLERLGIVACEKCGGSGLVSEWFDLPHPHRDYIPCHACHRNGKSHGWVMRGV